MATPAAEEAADLTTMSPIAEVERQFAHMLTATQRTFEDAALAVQPSLQPLGFTVMMTLN